MGWRVSGSMCLTTGASRRRHSAQPAGAGRGVRGARTASRNRCFYVHIMRSAPHREPHEADPPPRGVHSPDFPSATRDRTTGLRNNGDRLENHFCHGPGPRRAAWTGAESCGGRRRTAASPHKKGAEAPFRVPITAGSPHDGDAHRGVCPFLPANGRRPWQRPRTPRCSKPR